MESGLETASSLPVRYPNPKMTAARMTLTVQHQTSSIRTHPAPRSDCQRENYLVSGTKELDSHYTVYADRSWKHKKEKKDEMKKDEAK